MIMGGFVFWFGFRRVQSTHSRRKSGLWKSVGGFLVVVMVVFVIATLVVADEADVDADQKGEDEGLDEADEKLQEVERNRQAPAGDGRHGVDDVFAAEGVAVESQRKGTGRIIIEISSMKPMTKNTTKRL
jgi:hypothetical protein